MKPKHILPALLTAMTLSQSGCNPIQEDTRAQVDLIMKWSEPTPENDRLLKEANDFYSNQSDFKALTPRQQAGKVILRKILSQAAATLKEGKGLQEFCRQVLQSADSPIDNSEVGFKVENDTGVDIKNIVFSDDEWEIFTEGRLFNRLLKDPKVTSAELNGETLEFTVTGKESSLETLNKNDAFSRFEGNEISQGTISYRFHVSPKIIDPKTIAAK